MISSEIFLIEAWQDWNQDVLWKWSSESLLRTEDSMSVSLLDGRSCVCASEKAGKPCHTHMLPIETETGSRQNKTIPLSAYTSCPCQSELRKSKNKKKKKRRRRN